jgi:hypothetical protein
MRNLILAAGLALAIALTPSTTRADHWYEGRPYYGHRYGYYGPRYYYPRPWNYGYDPYRAYRYSMPYYSPYHDYRAYVYPYYYAQPGVSFGFTFVP